MCIIFSLYVLLLSASPCCSDDICTIKSSIKKEFSQKNQTAETECAGCSPFFSCGTCVGFVIAKPVVHSLLFVSENPVKHYNVYRQPFVKEVAMSIWQPPKLG